MAFFSKKCCYGMSVRGVTMACQKEMLLWHVSKRCHYGMSVRDAAMACQ